MRTYQIEEIDSAIMTMTENGLDTFLYQEPVSNRRRSRSRRSKGRSRRSSRSHGSNSRRSRSSSSSSRRSSSSSRSGSSRRSRRGSSSSSNSFRVQRRFWNNGNMQEIRLSRE